MCDLCNNIGWRARELGPAQYQLVPCVCMEPRLAAAARARLQETSNLIGDLVNKRFSDYRPDRTGQQEALELTSFLVCHNLGVSNVLSICQFVKTALITLLNHIVILPDRNRTTTESAAPDHNTTQWIGRSFDITYDRGVQ